MWRGELQAKALNLLEQADQQFYKVNQDMWVSMSRGLVLSTMGVEALRKKGQQFCRPGVGHYITEKTTDWHNCVSRMCTSTDLFLVEKGVPKAGRQAKLDVYAYVLNLRSHISGPGVMMAFENVIGNRDEYFFLQFG